MRAPHCSTLPTIISMAVPRRDIAFRPRLTTLDGLLAACCASRNTRLARLGSGPCCEPRRLAAVVFVRRGQQRERRPGRDRAIALFGFFWHFCPSKGVTCRSERTWCVPVCTTDGFACRWGHRLLWNTSHRWCRLQTPRAQRFSR